ncbi:MAG: nuclear transport factor 2 family protein [Nevskia sp.]|nr:nuclear transport factor 2 family protein [Nevskia sp.]
MLSLQEISDRLEIQQLFVDYSTAIDRKDFDALDRVFTPDAYIDYRAMGGIDGRYPQIKAWLAQVLPNFPRYYHMLGNPSIRVEGDRAASSVICFNPMQVQLPDGQPQVMFLGLWYHDKLLRTPQGWRLIERVEEKCFDHNVPGGIGTG